VEPERRATAAGSRVRYSGEPVVLLTRPSAVVHVDLDGATQIFRAHGWSPSFKRDTLFESGLTQLLAFFDDRRIVTTLFVIAEDLNDPVKRTLIVEAARRGHEIASHTVTHRHLTGLSHDERIAELTDSRRQLEDVLGVPVSGFRAPGFAIDRNTLRLVAEAGYRYDSSVFLGRRAPAGALYVGENAGALERETGLRELAMPRYDGLPWPFHPSYSQLLGTRYFSAGFSRAMRLPADPFVFLIHLTDLSDPMITADLRGFSSRVFTLSVLSAATKARRLARMMDLVQARCEIVPTASLITGADRQ
jgi:peptidoglycan/xylan/chitin deacetylase (PgdA/CDA1 family)